MMAGEAQQLPLPEPARSADLAMQELVQRATLALLVVYAQGRANAITGRRLTGLVAQALAAEGVEFSGTQASLARRVRAAIGQSVLLGARIGSSSTRPRGYYHANSLAELEDGARTLRQHLVGTARRLRAYDAATADAVLRLLGQEPLPLASSGSVRPVTDDQGVGQVGR